VGQVATGGGGMSRRRSKFDEAWVPHMQSMIESPAWRTLSRGGHQFISRLEAEHCRHGGTANGELIVTYADCVAWGMDRDAVGPAQREAVALGFVRLAERGRAGNAEHRRAHRWGLTYIRPNADKGPPATDDWKRFKMIEDAERAAKEARKSKNAVFVAAGKRRAKKQNPVRETPTMPVRETPTTEMSGKPRLRRQSGKPRLLSTSSCLSPRPN
jgi:hypothetical protein